MNLQTGKNNTFYLWPLILFAALLTGVHAQEEDRGFVRGGGYFVYQCPSFEESVARLSFQGRQNLRDMCLEDTDVEDCVHQFFGLPSGCQVYLRERRRRRFPTQSLQLEDSLRRMGHSKELRESAQRVHQRAIRGTSGK